MAFDLNEFKSLLADSRYRIRLDEVVSQLIKDAMKTLSLEHFPLQGVQPSGDTFRDRIQRYGEAVIELRSTVALIGRWGEADALLTLEKAFARLSEAEGEGSGFRLWSSLSWYPLHLLMYAAGMAALSARRFEALRSVLLAPIATGPGQNGPLVIPATTRLADTHDGWKLLPGLERCHTPRSDFLFEELREPLEDLLFLGASYEDLFDEFELWVAMVFVHAGERDWGPIGRFGWKRDAEVFVDGVTKEAQKAGRNWAPLRAGFFNGSPDEFLKSAAVVKGVINRAGWY